ncbi:hypothetical protein KFE25_014186 [Diacronema lutheri]|uniref:Cyclic nucleotide-binding domain-containing protein n=1 Tax=Diacronema lutheri TaxID=2081491 RepID=A0A8J6C6E6_DIALT|nr:hypothetical protein KFE25_014186 [Diacronema lutheri]
MGCAASSSEARTTRKKAPVEERFTPTFAAGPPKGHNYRRRNSISAEADRSTAKYVRKVVPKSASERAFLARAVSGIFLFADLHATLLNDVLDAMEKKVVADGERLMAQGAKGDNFYVIESGKYRVLKDGKQVFEYSGAGFFGELALMYNTSRSATVEAASAGVVWALDRATFRHLVTSAQEQRAKVSQESLAKVVILQSLSVADRRRLGDALVAREYTDGEVVIVQGAYGGNMFLIEEGKAVACQDATVGGKVVRKEVFTHNAGDYFGERALITDEPRAATVLARGPLKVWTIDRAAFERLLGSDVKERMLSRVKSGYTQSK